MKNISTCAEWINFRKLLSTLYRFVSFFHQLMLYYQNLHHTICISAITHYIWKYPLKFLLPQKFPLNILQSSMELFEQHLNNRCGSMDSMERKQQNPKSHEIPWNFVLIQISMEFHGTFSILPIFIEFHGIPWNISFYPKKLHGILWNSKELFWSSMELHGIPYNLTNLIF